MEAHARASSAELRCPLWGRYLIHRIALAPLSAILVHLRFANGRRLQAETLTASWPRPLSASNSLYRNVGNLPPAVESLTG